MTHGGTHACGETENPTREVRCLLEEHHDPFVENAPRNPVRDLQIVCAEPKNLVDEDQRPVKYYATSSIATCKFAYPVPGYVGTAGKKYRIRRHFHLLHPYDLLDVPGDGLYPECG